jgi:hypothetical protein
MDTYTDRLSEYLDGELTPAARADVEAHLRGCPACREVLAELQAVIRRAGSLPDPPPSSNLWPGIEARIAAGARVVPFAPRRFSFTLPQLVAASLALMLLSGSMVWLARLGGTDIPRTAAVDPASLERPIELTPAKFNDEHYDEAIADLQETLNAGRAKLDPDTVRILEANLKAIDAAIEQCRLALENDPANVYLNNHLAQAKQRKLALLRRAMALTDTAS